MSIASYAEVKTAVANWLNRADLTTYIPDLVRFGEIRIYRDLRLRTMETALNSTIASGVIALPTDYVDLRYAYVNGATVQFLERKPPEFIYTKYPIRSVDGLPKYIAREGENFIFGPYPDSNYTIKGIYYKRLTALSDSNTTNWFTTNAPDLLVFAALIESEVFVKNDVRMPMWQAKYDQVLEQISAEEQRERYSGSSLATSVA